MTYREMQSTFAFIGAVYFALAGFLFDSMLDVLFGVNVPFPLDILCGLLLTPINVSVGLICAVAQLGGYQGTIF